MESPSVTASAVIPAYPDPVPTPARKAPVRKVVTPTVAKAKRAAVLKRSTSRVKGKQRVYER